MEDVAKTAVGVFIGALAAMFTWEGIQYVRLEKAAYEARQEMERANAKMQAEVRRRNEEREAATQRQEEAMRERDRADAEVRRIAQMREKDKAEAWKNYFKPSPECVSDPNTMDCANAHIRAKTEFEAHYRHKR